MATRDYEMKSRPVNRGSSLFKPNPQTQLLNALHQRDLRAFRKLLLVETVDPNFYYEYPDYKTCLDIACSEAGMTQYVKLLLDNNANVNKINPHHNRAPLHFAVETGDVGTVQALIDDLNIDVNILSKGNTALHLAIKHIEDLDDDRESNIAKYEDIIKLLLKAGSDANIPDLKNITPIYSAAKQGLETIVKYIIEYSKNKLDLDSYKDRRQKTARMIIEQSFPYLLEKLPKDEDQNIKIDVHKLFSHISGHNENSFLKDFKSITDKEEIKKMLLENNGLYTLLQFACVNGLDLAVAVLLEKGADPNITAPGNNMTPVALACSNGYHKILTLLIANESTSFEPISGDSLLQLAIREEKNISSNPNVDFKLCQKILIGSKRTNPDINFSDVKANTALHYATKSGNQDIVLDLLRNGAYIGMKNKFNEPPMADISPKTFETFLDECITTNNERPNDENYELIFNYNFLVPPNHNINKDNSKTPLIGNSHNKKANVDILTPETDVLLYMSHHSDLKHLLNHPVITSFLYLKWQRISALFYANITFYVLFWLSLILYILLSYDQDKEDVVKAVILHVARITTIIGLIILTLREVTQIIVSPKRYIKSIENWLEISLIIVTLCILIYSDSNDNHLRQQLCAVAILLSSAELVLLIGQFPSLSTNIVMLKTVSWNFFKFLLWYCILIIAFSLSFYTLFRTIDVKEEYNESKAYNPNKPANDEEETNFFLDPGMSLFKTIVMLTGEFDAASINFESFPVTSHIIFIIFVFMIPIVLFNLLNGLAVSDTQAIKSNAELVSHISRIQLISYFESVLLGDMIPYKNAISNLQNACCWLPGHTCVRPRMICIRPLAKRICLFPHFLPMAQISVKVNQSLKIDITQNINLRKKQIGEEDPEISLCFLNQCYELHMDRYIVKKAKQVLSEQNEEQSDVKKIQKKLDTLEKLMHQIINSMQK